MARWLQVVPLTKACGTNFLFTTQADGVGPAIAA